MITLKRKHQQTPADLSALVADPGTRIPDLATPKYPRLAKAAETINRRGWVTHHFSEDNSVCALGGYAVGNNMPLPPDPSNVRAFAKQMLWMWKMDFNRDVRRLAAAIRIDITKVSIVWGYGGDHAAYAESHFFVRWIQRKLVRMVSKSPSLKVAMWNDFQARDRTEVIDTIERVAYNI